MDKTAFAHRLIEQGKYYFLSRPRRFGKSLFLLTPEGRTLQQIKDQGYTEKYRTLGQPIHLIGIEFNRASRNVVGFEVEAVS